MTIEAFNKIESMYTTSSAIIASNNALMLEKSAAFSFSSLCDHQRCCIIRAPRRKFVCLSNSKGRATSSTAAAAAAAAGGGSAAADSSSTIQNKEDIVIVGAGIAGLATALCLHRLGIGSVVLEQAESLRTGGTSLTLFKNGWGVLDVMGVANELRPQFFEIQGMVVKTDRGRELLSFKFKDADKRQEVRAVERRILLQTLAHQLPPNTIRFASKLSNIQKSETDGGETILQLTNGNRLSAKIVIGCDGIRSPIATWMGFRKPNYVGYSAFRGLAHYPQGQPLPPKVTYTYGKGLRVGYVPVSTTKVYWFICYNTPSPPKPTSPSYLKSKALSLLQTCRAPPQLLNLIDSTPDSTISDTPIQDRWLWPITSPPVYKDNVVLVGDAWHPMTPNLGQGGCCALEDALVLANKIYGVRKKGGGSISDGFEEYGKERWKRLFGMTVRANVLGSLLQWENPVVCAVRDFVVVPNFVRVESLLEHTNFEIHESLDGSVPTL